MKFKYFLHDVVDTEMAHNQEISNIDVMQLYRHLSSYFVQYTLPPTVYDIGHSKAKGSRNLTPGFDL